MLTIYHNPRCSKSRQTLSLIEENGHTPTIIRYLETPLSASDIRQLLSMLKLTARDIIRKGEDAYKEAGLADITLSEEALINAIAQHPKLLERPIVSKGEQAIIGRPPENVLTLL